eukprot:CAMPEP_0185832840 /NCGR_PEP_ID=MMETSP1353-20130828/2325_1 /TAXON_ID=1077150 /ORGANISM="Erythrolobus australicus, Strain CCMP3124" /LENGTH=145 /DNA_ID=CAMNT_0028531067 /DNA_START=29 /DNA_END=462 /DNA_ORIENTATION=+
MLSSTDFDDCFDKRSDLFRKFLGSRGLCQTRELIPSRTQSQRQRYRDDEDPETSAENPLSKDDETYSDREETLAHSAKRKMAKHNANLNDQCPSNKRSRNSESSAPGTGVSSQVVESGDPDKRFMCAVCNFTFARKWSAMDHVRR